MVQYRKFSIADDWPGLRGTLGNHFLPFIQVKSFQGGPVTFKKCHHVVYLYGLTAYIWAEGAAGRLVLKVSSLAARSLKSRYHG